MSTPPTNSSNAFDRYQAAAARTANYDMPAIFERLEANPKLLPLLNTALGMAGEAGEFADHIKKVVFHGHELDIDYLLKECGDELWYVSEAVRQLNAKLSTAAGININKLKERYPDGFDEQRSINRGE